MKKSSLFTFTDSPAPKSVAGFILVEEGESIAQAIAPHQEPYPTYKAALADKMKMKKEGVKTVIYSITVERAYL